MEVVNEAVARATRDRDFAIRLQFSVEIARGKSPHRAIATVAYRSGLKQAQVREIIRTKPPATRRLPQEQERTA